MDTNFWHERWRNKQIAFHEGDANRMLVRHFGALDLPPGRRVFVPFCGKTRDIAWLLAAGYRVVGAELSELAIRELFAELEMQPDVSRTGGASMLHRSPEVEVFVGDFFDLSKDDLGPIDAVYDRAALIALPEDMRPRYTRHLTEVTENARQLLITLEYDQRSMDGPPFSVDRAELRRCYGDRHEVELLERSALPEKLKGQCDAVECAWLLV